MCAILTNLASNLQYLIDKMKLFCQIGQRNKCIECNINNDIPVKIPSFPYVLVNRSILYKCEKEAENYFLFSESLGAFQDTKSKVLMYFTVNTFLSITLTTLLTL